MFVINRKVLFPDECLRQVVDRNELGKTILEAGRAVTFIATGLEQAILCQIMGINDGYHYTGSACQLPEFLPDDEVLVIDLDGKSYLYKVHPSFGTPRLASPATHEKNLILP